MGWYYADLDGNGYLDAYHVNQYGGVDAFVLETDGWAGWDGGAYRNSYGGWTYVY